MPRMPSRVSSQTADQAQKRQRVSQGVQTVIASQREYISVQARSEQPFENEEWPDWLTRPHTVTVLLVTLVAMWAISHAPHLQTSDTRQSVIFGAAASVVMFLVFAVVQFPDGILVRPHPVVWRFVKGCSVMYLLLLIFLLFQKLDDVRSGLAVIDPTLGKPLPEKNYAEDCRVFTPEHPTSMIANIWEQCDVFVWAHFIGWLVKALVIRDWKLLWFLQLFFEWMEISLRHLLPNFWECWWDHLILDVFGCNLLGIVVGLWLVRKYELKPFRWRHLSQNWGGSAIAAAGGSDEDGEEEHGHKRLCSRSLGVAKLTPYTWTHYKWPGFLSNFETFIMLTFFSIAVTLLDLNLFFLKAELWLAPSHWINTLRTFFWGAAAASGTREFYEFMTDRNSKRMGVQLWLNLAIVGTELLLVIRYSGALVEDYPMPQWIKITWAFILASWSLAALYLFIFKRSPPPPDSLPASRRVSISNVASPLNLSDNGAVPEAVFTLTPTSTTVKKSQ